MRVDIYGLFHNAASGWGTHCRCFAIALAREHAVRAVAWDHDPRTTHLPGSDVPFAAPDPSADVAICAGPLDRTHEVVAGRYRIAFFAWETTRIASHHRAALQGFDEIWAPSRWGRDVLVSNGFAPHTVHVVPEGVATDLFTPAARPPDGRFRFLCVGKWEERKCIAELARCFSTTFAAEEDVELLLHAHNSYLPGFAIDHELAALGLGAAQGPAIRPSMPRDAPALAALYRDCHAFVLPTRGEGWGLPILEAMASGLPTIATSCSAQQDYLNEHNGYPVRVAAMVPVHDPIFYSAGEALGDWAEPDWDHLSATMRFVFDNRAAARERGARARHDAETLWSWQNAAQAASRRLAACARSAPA
jgi:glycosyltransferase involved in cell wall biosynthesis